ncbi:MarR family winged helix-turn-helix transcriptional regulator [Pelagibacterium limicola]|uniref:MarR family winged helix-turn-helix transcriptional regulator n=1 Tax=Pelagibacterium limicola TaxID=2791022 RepID=UPI0018AF616F|nr:MarR family transcriptional regulator [Pelagibacterium limicola]
MPSARPVAVEQTIAYHLRLAQEASFAAIRRRFGDPDLKPGHYTILSIIARNPGLTQGELSRASARDTSTLTSTLSELSRKGYVQRQRSDVDRRSYRIELTSAGKTHLARLEDLAVVHDALLDQIVGPENKSDLISMLKRIQDALSVETTLQAAQQAAVETA